MPHNQILAVAAVQMLIDRWGHDDSRKNTETVGCYPV